MRNLIVISSDCNHATGSIIPGKLYPVQYFLKEWIIIEFCCVCFTNNLYICSPVIAGNLFKIKV